MGLIRNEGFDFHHTDYLLELADSLGGNDKYEFY
jgi:hypothetical protein|tara:strand:+ start:47 stop:148 length:102 start_codon:yes stop_codon:yes gene_type:complete